VVVAIAMRRIGVALASLVYMMASNPDFKSLVKRLSLRTKLTIAAASAVATAGVMLATAKTSTLSDFAGVSNPPASKILLRFAL
jgi:hypothetical protein